MTLSASYIILMATVLICLKMHHHCPTMIMSPSRWCCTVKAGSRGTAPATYCCWGTEIVTRGSSACPFIRSTPLMDIKRRDSALLLPHPFAWSSCFHHHQLCCHDHSYDILEWQEDSQCFGVANWVEYFLPGKFTTIIFSFGFSNVLRFVTYKEHLLWYFGAEAFNFYCYCCCYCWCLKV